MSDYEPPDDLKGVPVKNLVQAEQTIDNVISRVEYVETLTGAEGNTDATNFGDSTGTALSGLYDASLELRKTIESRMDEEATSGVHIQDTDLLLFDCPDCDTAMTVFENEDGGPVTTTCVECDRPIAVRPTDQSIRREEVAAWAGATDAADG